MPVFDESRSWFNWPRDLETVEVCGYTLALDPIDSGLHVYIQGVVSKHLGKFFTYLPMSRTAGLGRIRAAIKREINQRE